MAAFPKELKKEIMKHHPELTESDIQRYVRLIYELHSIDPLKFPDRREQVERRALDFIEAYLPGLDEAQSAYESKAKERYEKDLAEDLPGPVDIALADENVERWLSEKRAKYGQYDVDYRLHKKPFLYEVEFKFKNGSELLVSVEQYKREVAIVFQRMKV
jgi:hypothetical protein